MNKTICQGEIDILLAIDEVRRELTEASKAGADLRGMREIHSRLMSLYAALNVENILIAIDSIDHKESA